MQFALKRNVLWTFSAPSQQQQPLFIQITSVGHNSVDDAGWEKVINNENIFLLTKSRMYSIKIVYKIIITNCMPMSMERWNLDANSTVPSIRRDYVESLELSSIN